MEVARYGQSFKDRAVAWLLPPESAAVGLVASEVGMGAGARFEVVVATAAMPEAGKSVWCREHGMYPAELDTDGPHAGRCRGRGRRHKSNR